MARKVRIEFPIDGPKLYRALPTSEEYMVIFESDDVEVADGFVEEGHRSYFTYATDSKKEFVNDVLFGLGQPMPSFHGWMHRLAMQLGQDVRAYVMPSTQVRRGGVNRWGTIEAEAKRIHFRTARFIANGATGTNRKVQLAKLEAAAS